MHLFYMCKVALGCVHQLDLLSKLDDIVLISVFLIVAQNLFVVAAHSVRLDLKCSQNQHVDICFFLLKSA